MWQQYFQPQELDDALALLARYGEGARIVAGGTDVIVELSRGIRPTSTLIDITAIPGLRRIGSTDGIISLGALTTHNDVVASPLCRQRALPLARACWEVGAPQIRTRGTIAGNLITASPANDTITPLVALEAEIVLASIRGDRVIPLQDFYLGVRRTALAPDELLREIRFPAMRENQRGHFIKLGLRRAQAISVIDAAAALACGAVSPIDDVRGTATYRLQTLQNLLAHTLEELGGGEPPTGIPQDPVLLDTNPANADRLSPDREPFTGTIKTRINGRAIELRASTGCTLLDAVREEAGLTGTKEGCAEGECGACTVWLEGQAVMACLVPAPQAHNAEVVTIEGLAARDGPGANGLHPLQQTFIDCGAVQCGYCIPGMLMAGAKLLQERPTPDLAAIETALSGNICRCTGYRKIFDAVQAAGNIS